MPRYYTIRNYEESMRNRVLERLLDLRNQLDTAIPHTKPDSLLLATWNIRDFDSNKFKNGPRIPETFNYLAEIISRFDLVAIQEINRDLAPLNKLLWHLGSDWDYIVTSVTEGSAGNVERMAYVFNTKRVRFTNLAGQVVLPKKDLVTEEGLQFSRTPYVASFQAGWFKFNLCTVHIYFGSESGAALARRVDEINKIAAHFKKLNQKEPGDYILLGDFNIVSPQHKTMDALKRNGFNIPEPLKKFTTNLARNKYYDQIAFKQTDKRLEFGQAGVFDYRTAVFRNEDFEAYYDFMPPALRDFHTKGKKKGKHRTKQEKKDYYMKEWITWQMSDHLLLWCELKVDFTNAYLKSLFPGEKELADFS